MMNEQDLMEALEDRVGDVPVGPAPVDAMTTSAARTRRRTGIVAGAAAAVVAVVASIGIAQVIGADDPSGDGQDVATETDVPPAGYRYVGLGRAAIAVPDAWPRNETECNAVPKATTYVVDLDGPTCMLMSVVPPDTDAVEVGPGTGVETTGWQPVEVDGEEALRSPVAEAEQAPELGGGALTTVQVYLPDLDVLFTAQSTISAANVDDLLDGIVVLDDQVGVPGFSALGLDGGRMDEEYTERLEALGLEVELLPQLDRMQRTPGEVIEVEPLPGTVVAPGTVVKVRAAE